MSKNPTLTTVALSLRERTANPLAERDGYSHHLAERDGCGGPLRASPAGVLAAAAWLAVLWLAAVCCGQSRTQLDFVMFTDPRLELPPDEVRFRPELLPLWLAALDSPEADLRQQSARTIAWVQAQSVPGLEAAIGPLTRNVKEDERRIVRLTAAQTLVALDARQSAQVLFDRCQTDGLDMAQLVEPALARWRFPPAIELWRRRLEDESIDRQRRLLAIRALGEARDQPAADPLLRIAVAASQPADVRLAAATAVAQVRRSGLEDAARRLRSGASPDIVDRLVAVRLLREHDSAGARTLLLEMVQDEDSSVVAGALEPLVKWEPARVIPLAKATVARGDANVRRLVAVALAACPSADNVSLLGDLLADPIPSLRASVRQSLEKLAHSPEWRPEVLRQGERMVHSERWTALEQSIVLLGTLNHVPPADRFVELLEHPRAEVYVAAAWGLRRLGIDRTLAPALDVARKRNGNRQELLLGRRGRPDLDHQLAHLFEFFGQKKHAPAEPFLRTFVAKDLSVTQARSAAIWALGHFHENQPDAELVKALQARLNDTGMPPEDEQVRRFCAVTLGRMKASAALPALETFNEPNGIVSPVGYACAWSVERLTGKPIPPRPVRIKYHVNFFLEPTTAEPAVR
ncbi:MAG TPA: hypothetical protein PLF81_26950 [Candidatus Anammoximicrobium sp.]|nr:hypothetical protein [Candidatus Anammoximicrobium sp.]